MKKRLLSKMVAFAAATVLVLGSNGLTAFAADGTAADGPKDSGTTNESTGKATAEYDTIEDAGWSVTNDDDNKAAASDTQTDISIWAKVVEHGDIVYKVDISWGAMKFEFNNQAGKWNTETHQYDATDAGVEKEWTVAGYINGTNNEIVVENHSNWAVNAEFSYTHEGTSFNTDKNGADAVRGHFFLDNDDAVKASKVLVDSANLGEDLKDKELKSNEELTLGHQDKSKKDMYGGTDDGESLSEGEFKGVTENTAGSCLRKVYFTFNGTPDIAGMNNALKTDFTKVGVITVTIAPYVKGQ